MNQVFSETGESIFSTVTRLAREHGAINLGQGFPDFLPPEPLRQRLHGRIDTKFSDHQYAPSPGILPLRRQVSRLYKQQYDLNYDPETEITITTGATEGLSSTLYGLLNEGDEVIMFDPVYDLYAPVARRAGATIKVLPLQEPGFRLPVKRLKREASEDTTLIVINNPHNPTGRVFSRTELEEIVHVAEAHDTVILSDEVYEQLTFDGHEHIPMASLKGARHRTITTGSVGKLFNATGWKIGWTLAPEPLTRAVRSAHQFSTFSTATPLQVSVAEYLSDGVEEFLETNRNEYVARRQQLLEALKKSPFEPAAPEGTYFAVAKIPEDWTEQTGGDDLRIVRALVKDHGLAAIPLSAFYVGITPESHYLRFAFCKEEGLLDKAAEKLRQLEGLTIDRTG